MSAPTFDEDLKVYVGATFEDEYLIYEDFEAGTLMNLTAYTTAKMQIRASYDAAAALVTLTNGSGLTLGGAAGSIGIRIEKEVTALLSAGTAVYDLFLYKPDGTAYMSLRGSVTIYPRATQ